MFKPCWGVHYADEAGKSLGRAWAIVQQSFDLRRLDPDSEYVEISLYDLTFALRERGHNHECMAERTNTFIEGGWRIFTGVEDWSDEMREERRPGRSLRRLQNGKDDEMSNDKGKLYADMDPAIKDMLPDSEVFENEEQALDYLKRHRKLLAPSSRAFDEGGTVSELLARFAEYAARDPEVAREAGRERGRAWASDQESWDPRWASLAVHSSREVYVEVTTWDLASSTRDREYGAYADEYANAFIETAQAYFREQGS